MSKDIDPLEETKTLIRQAFSGDKAMAHVDDIANFVKANYIVWNADESSKKLGIAFLDEADRDLKSCRALYQKKIYPHAVYHLQQSAEKAMKGYCLGLGILSIEEMRSHYTPYVLLKGLFEKTGMRTLLESLSEDAKDRLDRAWEAIYKPEKRLAIAKITFQEIIGHLHDIDKNEPAINELSDKLGQLLAGITPTEDPPPLFLQTLSILGRIHILGSISFPHEEFTRYPDREMTPPEYASDLGVVKGIPHMIRYLAPAISDLRFRLAQHIAEA